MDQENNPQRKRKVSRQNWKPNRFLKFLYGLWLCVYSGLKIALGAVVTVLLIGIICGFVFLWTLSDYLQDEIKPQAGVQLEGFDLNEPSYLYYTDSDGNIQVLQKLHADVNREWADYEDIPEDLINAAVAIEDHRFFEHQGVDWFTTVKACVNMFVGSGDQFGGSSITQQLIKNLLLPEDARADDVTVQRKVLEIFRATEFEKRYDKTIVMEWYLNRIYLGNRCEGVRAAAAKYFGKELEHLTAAECACLISITNNPSLYDPYRTKLDKLGMTGMEQNEVRRTNTLYMMREYGYLTEEEYQEALAQEIVLKDGIDPEDRIAECLDENCAYSGKVSSFDQHSDGKYYCPQCGAVTAIGENASTTVYSWFVESALKDVAKQMAERDGVQWSDETKDLYIELICNGGYHIYTTLDMEIQEQVDKIYTNLEEIPETNSVQQLQSGIVVIDNATGDVVAMSGGVGEKEVFFAYNRAEVNLQPGSSIKPLTVYGPAFELGVITPATVQKDMPLYYNTGDGGETTPYPKNTGKANYAYSRNILEGLTQSINTIAVHTLNNMGLEYSFEFAKDKFGLSSLVERYVRPNGTVQTDLGLSPLAMGAPTFGVTVREMATAYATFANNGVYRESRTFLKVYNSDGEVVLTNDQDYRQVMSQKATDYMNQCLENAVAEGTGTAADIDGQDVAGKTGSTTSNKDRWFCGYTQYYTAAVWCGYDKPEVISLVGSSRNPACRLFKKVMEPIHEDLPRASLYKDDKLVKVGVCLDSGHLATDTCANDVRGSRIVYAWVYPEDTPAYTCTKHITVDYCENGVANDYCRMFAAIGQAKFTAKSLVMMTQEEVNELAACVGKGLQGMYAADNYIYYVDSTGLPLPFYGLKGTINAGLQEPCQVCTKHNQSTWNAYLTQHDE